MTSRAVEVEGSGVSATVRAYAAVGAGARGVALFAGVAALVVVTIANLTTALARLVNYPVNSAFEMQAFAGVWLGMLAAAYTESRRSHIDAGISLHRLLPWRSTKLVFGVLRTLMVALFLVLLLWTGWQQAWSSIQSHEITIDTLAWVVWPAQIAVPLGSAAWLIVLLTPQPKAP